MKKALLLILLFYISLNTQLTRAQYEYRDELKEELTHQEKPFDYLQKIEQTETSNIKKAIIHNRWGLLYQYENDLDSALIHHKQALYYALSESEKNEEIGVSYNKIGVIHYFRGQFDTAIYFFEHSIPYYESPELEANSLNNLAIMYNYNSNPDKALENYISSLELYKELKDTAKQVIILNNIGSLHFELEHLDQSKLYLDQSLELALLSNDRPGEMQAKTSISNLHFKNKEYKKAIKINLEVIEFCEQTADYRTLIVNKNNLANCYTELNQHEQAINEYLSVLDLMDQTGLSQHKESILINIASQNEKAGNNEEALKYYNEAYQIARSNQIIIRLETIYKGLSSVYQKLGQSDSSLFYKDLQIELRDSLDQVEKEKKMLELEAQFQNKELSGVLSLKEEQLSQAELDKQKFSKRFAYSVIIALVLIITVIVIFNRYKKSKKEQKQLSNKKSIVEQNLTVLEEELEEKNKALQRKEETGLIPYPENLEPLTEREKEVLLGVKEGLKDKEIAEKLFISISTVRTHLRKAYVKIDARNRAEAIQFISTYDI